MPAPVLAALDPVTLDLAPARFAALVASYTGARVVVAAVYADADSVGDLAGGQFGEELAADAASALERAADDLSERGGDRPETLAVGAASAPRGLEMAVEQVGPSVLVIGSSRSAQPGRVAAGSTGERLLNGTPAPVALVPRGWAPDGGGLATVGAGFVDTAEGRAALDGAHALAAAAGARLRVLAAAQPRSWMDGGADLRTAAEEASGAAVADVLGEPVDVDVEVGEPSDVLLAASAELDLLICGGRGYGTRPAVLLGGVTRRLAEGAGCPLIVMAAGSDSRPGR